MLQAKNHKATPRITIQKFFDLSAVTRYVCMSSWSLFGQGPYLYSLRVRDCDYDMMLFKARLMVFRGSGGNFALDVEVGGWSIKY